jgi:hypothetical protein
MIIVVVISSFLFLRYRENHSCFVKGYMQGFGEGWTTEIWTNDMHSARNCSTFWLFEGKKIDQYKYKSVQKFERDYPW